MGEDCGQEAEEDLDYFEDYGCESDVDEDSDTAMYGIECFNVEFIAEDSSPKTAAVYGEENE